MVSLISASALEWPIIAGKCGADGPDGITPDQWAAAKDGAVAWLWALSGRQFGTWDVVFRPEWTTPVPQSTRCCTALPALNGGIKQAAMTPLPGPAKSVTEVLVDGVVLASSKYLLERDLLVRTDGLLWQPYQDTTKVATQAGTWQITYVRGKDVPAAGLVAAGVLACELAAAMLGDGSCRLPFNVQSVARNGVTISMDATQVQLGMTRLPEIDSWIRVVNPSLRRSNPTVWSPDIDPDLLPPIPAASLT